MSTPNPDDHSELREALRRDAARLQEPPFDAALHHATIRRIRALTDAGATRSRLRLIPTLATGAALLLVIVVIFTRREPTPARPDVAAAISSTQKTIASLSVEPTASLPAWMSPTASLLEQPRLRQ
jgi:hypothetical protein